MSQKIRNPTPNEMQIAVEKVGYDIFPVRQENGNYLISVWRGEEFVGLGKKEYICWKVGARKTYKDFYDKIIKPKLK